MWKNKVVFRNESIKSNGIVDHFKKFKAKIYGALSYAQVSGRQQSQSIQLPIGVVVAVSICSANHVDMCALL